MAFNIRVFAIAAILLSATFGPAQSSRFTSAYSTLDLDLCTIRSRDRQAGGATWSCPPHNGIEIWVAEGDLRFFVSFGKKARKQPAASQTLPPWNRLNDTLEWRIGPDGRPVATILRWFTEFDGRADGQVLVVTRLPDATSKAVCHVAYVDARSNPDANVLARQAADTLAAGFDCSTQSPVMVGKPGPSL